ncbi:hypothetical protein LCGC14_2784280 [marine sediment metagenome]|uniref:YkgJ family cysteine cluster protein n=1 Tax=marine sediment metagenome TaxID=412755 RepID=A0A0F9B125_9ZZZZ
MIDTTPLPDYSGTPIRFECLQCGRCCKDILKHAMGSLKGPYLSPEETALFPPHTVSPSIGRGFDIDHITVTRYQINQAHCPQLVEDNQCAIYENRPLVCRRFPLMWSNGNITNIAHGDDCKFISHKESELGHHLYFYFRKHQFVCPGCWMAHDKEMRLIKLHAFDAAMSGMNIYSFDLWRRKWHLIDDLLE